MGFYTQRRGVGTSPRTRGKLPSMHPPQPPTRNIPAHAGKTPGSHPRQGRIQEHPRARGENYRRWCGLRGHGGTSPRTRGKRGHAVKYGHCDRNIPAHAGKTAPMHGWCIGNPEHPRARGENSNPNILRATPTGTSPRTRGKPLGAVVLGFDGRNIPAHAGKTRLPGGNLVHREEHPRARGENSHQQFLLLMTPGTSPRTRGKRQTVRFVVGLLRNIPAHAGKTFAYDQKGVAETEHPRARGENYCLNHHHPSLSGTSPRTRGKRVEYERRLINLRNIPAHAGKTIIL